MNGVGTPRCNPTTGANCTLAPKSSIPREAQIDELWIVKDAKKDPVLGAHGTITCLHVYLRLTLINAAETLISSIMHARARSIVLSHVQCSDSRKR